jgi:hypothetical protein
MVWTVQIALWVYAEMLLLIVTGIAVIAAVCRHEGRAADITVTRMRWGLLGFGLKGALR